MLGNVAAADVAQDVLGGRARAAALTLALELLVDDVPVEVEEGQRRQLVGECLGEHFMQRLLGDRTAAQAGDDAPFFEALRLWRAEKAREQGVPAYVILHDRTLTELAIQRPQSPNALLQIPGIGQAKAERYGEALLALLAHTN